MKQFWTCWVENSNGGYGRKHLSFAEAEDESRRLAQLPENEGKQVFILMCLGATIVKKTQWIPWENEDIPF